MTTTLVTVVVNAEDMEDETFIKHYNARHLAQDQPKSRRPIEYSPLATYYDCLRAYHRRTHHTLENGEYDHEHE